MRKIPMRKCVVTKEQFPKTELIRVVRTPEKNVVVDESGKMNGRGAYLKLDRAVIDKAQSHRALDRSLNVTVPQEVYEALYELIEDE